MARPRCVTFGLTLAALLTIGRTAAADPVRITSGNLTIGGAQDIDSRGFLRSISYDFSTESFRLRGENGDGTIQADLSRPSLVIPSFWTPSGGSDAVVQLSGPLIFTATPAPTPTPFELSGTLAIFDFFSGATLFNDAVSGSGTATWRFVVDPFGRSFVSGVAYQFQSDDAPIPEPGTIMLLAAGIALAAHRRRRTHETQ